MPIVITDTDWKETENTLMIKVPLKWAIATKTDIFYAREYLKISYEQYFFETFFLYPIKPKQSICTFTDNFVIFELVKEESAIWNKLEREFVSRTEKNEFRKKYIEEEHKIMQKEDEERRNRRCELKRVAVREQISIDSQQREKIENIKSEEKLKALQEMAIWNDTSGEENDKYKVYCEEKKSLLSINRQRSEEHTHFQPVKSSSTKIRNSKEKSSVPAPRSTRSLQVLFTPREFPTPCRESRLEEENEWLKKQAEARRSVGFISEDIRPEERNPQFLKAKGDEFMKNENYLGAISAYSFGITLNENFADLFVARAEAHLAIGNYNKTIQDCSKALELFRPAVQMNLKERALCVGRRGVALVKLGMVKVGIGELKASLRLDPHNEEFNTQLNEAEQLLNSSE